MHLIKSLLAALTLVTASFVAPVTVAFDTTLANHYVDKGSISSNSIVFNTFDLGYQSFGVAVKTYSPVLLSTGKVAGYLNRVDTSATYSFDSTLATLVNGVTLKHYKTPGATGKATTSSRSSSSTPRGSPSRSLPAMTWPPATSIWKGRSRSPSRWGPTRSGRWPTWAITTWPTDRRTVASSCPPAIVIMGLALRLAASCSGAT